MYRAYMAYSGYLTPADGAGLIFAHSIKEAKKLACRKLRGMVFEDWVELRVKWLKGYDHVFALGDKDKISTEESHVIDSPLTCQACELWGWGIDQEGNCDGCGERAGYSLEVASLMRALQVKRKKEMSYGKRHDGIQRG